jgi:hypothetical protein
MKLALLSLFLIGLLFAVNCDAQQTVFNVPSADVLNRGNVYGEIDGTFQPETNFATITPRVVVGVGHRVEVGINFNGFNVPGKQSLTPTPTVKWKIYDGQENGWSWLLGDDVLIPAQHRTYNAGNYVWTEAAHAWKSETRLTFGVYHATENVFGPKQKVGGQFAFEQPLNAQITFATDWYTGDSSIGYVTPGVIVKLTKQLTWYGTYQLGNHDLRNGNHQLLLELGWNVN